MSIRIEDGLGSGKSAGVDSSNRLKTVSVTQSALAEQSNDGHSFVVHGTHTIQSSNVEKVLYFKNGSSTKHVDIHRMQFSVLDGYETSTVVYSSFDPVYSSGGTATSALNLNRISGITSEIVAYNNTSADLSYTPDPTKVFMSVAVNKYCPTHVFYADGSIYLGSNSTMALCTQGPSGQVVSYSIYFTESVEL